MHNVDGSFGERPSPVFHRIYMSLTYFINATYSTYSDLVNGIVCKLTISVHLLLSAYYSVKTYFSRSPLQENSSKILTMLSLCCLDKLL